ncbi:MAG: mannitol 2-dehydrogenase, partial [Pseudonocardiales bacterium]|nr:mannitol 2-dehydrogenase [Pseudonocardiales bacterium]
MSNVVRLRRNTEIPLNNATLELHARRLAVPNYDRSALTESVVHVGVGGFHRAHQGTYFDDLARLGFTEWGVSGLGLHRRRLKEALEPQDCLYTVVEQGSDGAEGRVVGSMCRYLYTPDEHVQAIEVLADERTALVTLTITGDGYHRDAVTGDFDAGCSAVRRDLSQAGPYTTAWAYLVEALDRRRLAGLPPFTVMSCDNLPDNGGAARKAVVGFAAQRSARLAKWIECNVAFPSTMVDRITPVLNDAEIAGIQYDFGIIDRCPVVAEPFRQWVVEDAFSGSRPPLDEVGVEFVSDISPHKLVKTRLLNGSHCAMSYLGILLGHQTTDAAMSDSNVYRYVERLMRTEVSPLLRERVTIDCADYQSTLLERFSNPGMPDKLSRLAARGSVKMPSYLLPSLHEGRAENRPTAMLTLALAAWIRYLRGYDLQGKPIVIEDQRGSELRTLALTGLADPRPLLNVRDVFGSLVDDVVFVEALE